jgi:acyl dehydratase
VSIRLLFEDLNVGDQWNTHGRTMTKTDIVNFACMTGDFNPLHIDEEYAARTRFGQTIAHGLLGIAWAAGLSSQNPAVNTTAFVGIRNWQFLRPVYQGDTLTVETRVAEKHPKSRREGRIVWLIRVCNQRTEIVQEGYFETLVACRESVNVIDGPHDIPPLHSERHAQK